MKARSVTRSSLTMLVLFLLSGGRGVALAPQDPLALLQEAGRQYREIEGFCASFQQELSVPLLGDTITSMGSLCQAHPNLFAMRFSDPEGDVLVADGEFFWVYYPSSDPGQVLQFDMDVRPGGVDFHREFLEAPGEKYEMDYVGEDSVSGRSTHLIHLKPKEPAGFREARIWLDAERALILRAALGMEEGSVRTVTLSDLRLNPPPDPDRYRFVPPPGAQVIRRR